MSRGLIFWVLMLLAFIGCLFPAFNGGQVNWYPMGMTLLQFVLFALLGWSVYGPAIKD